MKVRKGLARGDDQDPGWYRHPPGTLAREVSGGAPEAVSAPDKAAMAARPGKKVIEVTKPGGKHHGH